MGTVSSAQIGDEPVLLADIGGTNCRLLLESGDAAAGRIAKVYSTDDFPSPEEAIQSFLSSTNAPQPKRAALAVAGIVADGRAKLTNTSWQFDSEKLEQALGLDQVLLANDLAAQARAVLDLGDGDRTRIGKPSSPPMPGSIAVVGPGTGLGVANAAPAWRHVTATEGGHVGFAPHDDLEMQLLSLWRQHLGRVTNEHVISGPGLVRLYRAMGALADQHVDAIQGPEIVRRAKEKEDELCVDVIDRFAKIFGSVCGDITLAQGATSVVLIGGIANSLVNVLKRGGFRARFEQRGPGLDMLRDYPTHVATPKDLGLMGARLLLEDAKTVQVHV